VLLANALHRVRWGAGVVEAVQVRRHLAEVGRAFLEVEPGDVELAGAGPVRKLRTLGSGRGGRPESPLFPRTDGAGQSKPRAGGTPAAFARMEEGVTGVARPLAVPWIRSTTRVVDARYLRGARVE
jgi:hypothetical protein